MYVAYTLVGKLGHYFLFRGDIKYNRTVAIFKRRTQKEYVYTRQPSSEIEEREEKVLKMSLCFGAMYNSHSNKARGKKKTIRSPNENAQ